MTATQSNAYLRTKVMTANPAELRLMLFDGAIKFAQQMREGLAEKNYEKAFNGTTRCQNIVLELINGLRPEHAPDLCEKLTALYLYVYRRLIEAGTLRDEAIVDEIVKLLRYERETWQLLLDKLAQENTEAGSMSETPSASPPVNRDESTAENGLIGGSVSLQG